MTMSTPKEKDDPVNGELLATSQPSGVTEEDIAQRAYQLYLARGGEDGHALDDWLQAERELRGQNPAAA